MQGACHPSPASTGPGTHVCALYSGPAQRDKLLVGFIEEGLRAGNQCLCLVDRIEPEEARRKIARQAGFAQGEGAAQLSVRRADDVYLESGQFSSKRMLSYLSSTADSAAEGEFPVLRAAGEMSWVIPLQGRADPDFTYDYFAYETGVNEVVAQKASVFMCMYDLERFSATMLADVLKTHPKVLLDGAVLDNPHCLAPEEFLAARRDLGPRGYPLTRMSNGHPRSGWQSLTPAERRVTAMVSRGMTNKVIAEQLMVSPHTVDAHLKRTYTKLDIHSRVELTVLAIQHGPVAGVN
jgi:DNA-binding CsgD family transcriptional regulator